MRSAGAAVPDRQSQFTPHREVWDKPRPLSVRRTGAAVCPRPPPLLRLLNHNLEEVVVRAVGAGRDLLPLATEVVRAVNG